MSSEPYRYEGVPAAAGDEASELETAPGPAESVDDAPAAAGHELEPVSWATPEPDPGPAYRSRPDPRDRPADPAGTQPKVDPDSLVPPGPPPRPALTAGPAIAGDALPVQQHAAPPTKHTAGGRSGPPPYARRFAVLKGALAGIGVAAVAAVVVLLTGPSTTSVPAPRWSAWQPSSSSSVDEAQQIAQHVAPAYRLPSGQQLVSVTGGPPAYQGEPLLVALGRSGSQLGALPGNAVLYTLCGSGASCSIPGKASAERGLLVERESLELALYTMHYVSGVNDVLVIYPPLPPGTKGASSAAHRVLLFRASDFKDAINRPLADTLSASTPTLADVTRFPDSRVVGQLVNPLVYDFTLITPSSSEPEPVLVLEPPNDLGAG